MNFRKNFRLFSRKSSKEVAKDRLKILLISDRINCSPEVMERIKMDLVKSISKYMSIDVEHMEIMLKKNSKRGRNRKPSLYACIPILDIHE
ncbi:MAG: cell division topological specificity factor MinE [Lachnospiraceae bacterium]